MITKYKKQHRLEKAASSSLSLKSIENGGSQKKVKNNVALPMGWGKLIFGQTFIKNESLAEAICDEKKNERNIALYIRDPHVVIKFAPVDLFLDPSHTFRLWSYNYRHQTDRNKNIVVRRINDYEDSLAVNRLYMQNKMVETDAQFMNRKHLSQNYLYLVAEAKQTGQIIGTTTGVDHVKTFNDPENGSSMWCLAVDPQSEIPGVGEALVRHVVEYYFAKGREHVDISVLHDNKQAISLYEKIGFQRIPVFCIKKRNVVNERLYTPPTQAEKLNIYSTIILDEARRRGIGIEILDGKSGYFRLSFGGRSVICRESLSEMTSAIAMSWCDDKRITRNILQKAGLHVPRAFVNQRPPAGGSARWVVKPVKGEQGKGISVDVSDEKELDTAIALARSECRNFLVEEYVEGKDLRVIVIDYKVVAAAVREPATITGTGQHTIRELIEKYNRRRMAATAGESSIPLDEETFRCINSSGYGLDDILPINCALKVRKTANLHTGGTIHDVTDSLNSHLKEVAVVAAKCLQIPVTGLDFIVPDVSSSEYMIIEANERPGLANHEPQPTAERFLDYLFPQSAKSIQN